MLRDYLNEHPLVTAGFALAVPVLILCVIWRSAAKNNAATRSVSQAWYTDDDGKTWYADDKTLSPPFDHKGKTSVRAFIYSCDGGKTEFVGYLQRYTPEAKQAIEQSRAQVRTENVPPSAALFKDIETSGIEIKKPGESNWVNVRTPQAQAIRKVKCPTGGNVQEVTP
jgi:hypothetical protein